MLLLLLACAGPDVGDSAESGGAGDAGESGGGSRLGTLPADFALTDLNPGSDRYGDTLSPRDYLTRVSGYYFIHST